MLFFGDARILPGQDIAPHLDDEVAAVDELMRRGFIKQLFRHLDGTGAILIIESESAQAAEEVLATLPFVRHGVMRIPVSALEERPQPA